MASRAGLARSRLPLRQTLGRLLFIAWVGLVVAPMAALASAPASTPTPTVSLPPAGGNGFPFDTSSINLGSFG